MRIAAVFAAKKGLPPYEILANNQEMVHRRLRLVYVFFDHFDALLDPIRRLLHFL